MLIWKRRAIIMEILGFMFGRCVMFGINPIGMGYFLCMYGHEVNKGLLGIMILLGMATVMEKVEVMKYALVMGTVTVIVNLLRHSGKKIIPKSIYMTGAMVTIILSLSKGIFTIDYKTQILLSVLEGVVTGVFAYLLQHGCTYLLYHKRKDGMSNSELISVGMMTGVLIYGIPGWGLNGISFTFVIAYLLVLLSGYKYGSGVGAIAGAACGIALSFQNGETSLIGSLCILGISSGMFQEIGKLGAGAAFSITGISLGFLYHQTLLQMDYVKNLLAASVLFSCIPVKYLERVSLSTREAEDSYMKNTVQLITQNKFKSFSESLLKLSKSFDQIMGAKQAFGYQEVNDIFEEVSERFCRDCVRREECWNRNYQVTYESAQSIFMAAREKGCVVEEDVPLEFMKRCINVKAFVRETNRNLEIARVNVNWYNRLRESKEAVAEQLKGMAQVMKEFAADVGEIMEVKNELEDQMIAKLRSQHIDVKRLIMVENRRKQREIHLIAKMKWGRCVTSREVAVMLSQVLGKKMRPGEHTKNVVSKECEVMVFVEDTKYKILTGVARKSKEGEHVSGDNFSFLELENGQMAMILSDGMGSGANANKESEEVVELLEQMMETGIQEKTAIHLLNSIYALWSDSCTFSTIDLGILDLYSGNGNFIKLGAATSFIKKKDQIERVEAGSLPVGMFQRIEAENRSFVLEDGDFVIMVTDGILDSFGVDEKEACLELVLSEIKSNNPQEIADKILEKVLEVAEKSREDDMTVLVAGIWKK